MASDTPTKHDLEMLQRQFEARALEYELTCRDTKQVATQVPVTATRYLNIALARLHQVAIFIRGDYDPKTADAATRARLFKSASSAFRQASDLIQVSTQVIARNQQAMNQLKTEFKTQKTKADGLLTKSQAAIDAATREQTEKANMSNTLDSQLKTQVAARDKLLAAYRDWKTKDSIANAITEPFYLNGVWKFLGYVIKPLDFQAQAANAKSEVAKSESLLSETNHAIQQIKDSITRLSAQKDAFLALKGGLELLESEIDSELSTAAQCAVDLADLAKIARELYTKAHTLAKKAEILPSGTSSGAHKDALALLILSICEEALKGRTLQVDHEVNLIVQEVTTNYGSSPLPEDIVEKQQRIGAARSKRSPPAQHIDILGASYAGIDVTAALRHIITEQGNKGLSLGQRSPEGFIRMLLPDGKDPAWLTKKTLVVLYQFEGEDMEMLITWDGSSGDTEEVVVNEPLPAGKDRVEQKGWNITRIPVTVAPTDDSDEGVVSIVAVAYGKSFCSADGNPALFETLSAVAMGDSITVGSNTFGEDPEHNVKKSATVFYTKGLSPIFVRGAFDGANIEFLD